MTKTYATRGGSVHALAETSLDLAAGEFVSIVGPSGCGKSTLLLMVAGLLPSSGGTITIDGQVVQHPYTELGIVFQDAVLLEWRRVLGNVLLQQEIRGRKGAEYRQRADELLRLVGLEGFEDRYPHELSGGMRQRVAICRALVHDPPVLLMDEPFGAIDALTRDQLNLDLLGIWQSSPKTVLFVTHSIPEAVFLADRVVVMSPRPGEVVDLIDIDLPRPRSLSARETPEFGAYSRRIRHVFEAVGVLREEGSGDARQGS